MVQLTWEGRDGFDAESRRGASIVWHLDLLPFAAVQGGGHSGVGWLAPRSCWEAFVADDGGFDCVLVDGEPGRWRRKSEAKAAAEAAHVAGEVGADD